MYKEAMAVDFLDILNNIVKKNYRIADRISKEMLGKIQLGAKKSDLLSDELRQYFKYF